MGNSITPFQLKNALDGPMPPVLIDVRKDDAYRASGESIPGAIRIAPDAIGVSHERFVGVRVVVYCVHGHEVSQAAHETLARQDIDVLYLEGGFEGWKRAGMPTVARSGGES